MRPELCSWTQDRDNPCLTRPSIVPSPDGFHLRDSRMARPKLSEPNQPLPLRWALKLYEFFASLKLAVVLIFGLATVLAFATFVESNLGTAAARYYVYHTKMFAALLTLLALCIFCAASIRYPWKRHQTGFVITHIGLLTLLAGSALSFRGNVNSQLLVFLGEASRTAIDNDDGFLYFQNLPGRVEPLRVAFNPGPFNWADDAPSHMSRKLKSLIGLDDPSQPRVHPPQVLYEGENIKVEIADFYSASEVRALPYLHLSFKQAAMGFELPIELEYDNRLQFAEEDFEGLASVMLWRTDDAEHWQAFQECIPERTVADEGAVVIWSQGEVSQLNVRELQKLKEAGEPFDLGDGRTVELIDYVPWADISQLLDGKGMVSQGDEPKMPAVALKVTEKVDGVETVHEIYRFARYPFMPNRDEPEHFLVEFYHPGIGGRIDILQGPDQRLAFRAWQQKLGRVVATGELKEHEPVATWSMGGKADGPVVGLQPSGQWMMTLDRYVTRDSDDEPIGVLPNPFQKDDRGISKRVKIRVSWLDEEINEQRQDEFWLKQNLPEPWMNPKQRLIHLTHISDEVTVRSEYRVRETDVGFAVKLLDFDLDVDPGTSMAANYTSHIVRIDVRNEPEVKQLRADLRKETDAAKKQEIRVTLSAKLQELIDQRVAKIKDLPISEQLSVVEDDDVMTAHVITMNAPFDYPDLNSRHLRFFQENYLPPEKSRQTPLGSIFRVNYDPGRPVKYLGSLLITMGIFLMFYMRAYFFKSIGSRGSRQTATAVETEKQPTPV